MANMDIAVMIVVLLAALLAVDGALVYLRWRRFDRYRRLERRVQRNLMRQGART